MLTNIANEKQELINAVLACRRELKDVLKRHGNISILQYVKTLTSYKNHRAYQSNLDKTCNLIQELYGSLWDKKLVNMACEKLYEKPSILTSDHAGVLMYPIYIQGNALFGLQELLENNGVILNFFSGLVPLDTASIPGGIFLSNTYDKKESAKSQNGHTSGRKLNANIFLYNKRRTRHLYVYDAPGFDKQKIKDGKGRIDALVNRKVITKNKAETLRKLLSGNLSSSHAGEKKRLVEQAALVNRGLFKEFFPGAPDVEFLNFQLEYVAAMWLANELKRSSSDSLTVEMLLNKDWRRNAKKIFNGINPGCWTFDDQDQLNSGTFLFWGIDESGRALKLREENGKLVGSGKFSINLERSSLLSGLLDKKIVPNIFLVFSVLAFENGLSCLGGFMQCWYLKKMKEGWISLLSHYGLIDQISLYETIPAQNYITGLTMFLLEREDGFYLPDGADIIGRNGIEKVELENLAKTTVKEAFLPGLPFIYRSIFGPNSKLNHVGISQMLKGSSLPENVVLRDRA